MRPDPTERELLGRYPPARFRRYPRWRPGWSTPAPRHLRFRYVEMMADYLRSQCANVTQTWYRDGVALACKSGETAIKRTKLVAARGQRLRNGSRTFSPR